MDTTNDHIEEDENTGLVRVAKSDLGVIIDGLKQLPDALSEMAEAVSILAKNTNRRISRDWITLFVLVCSLVVMSLFSMQNARLARETAGSQKQVNELVDCLTFQSEPNSECTRKNLALVVEVTNAITHEVRCEVQREFRRITEEMPNVDPTSVDEDCL